MLSASEGRRLGSELEHRLSTPRPSVPDELTVHASERVGRAEGDRFRDLGDPEYGLFLEDVPAATSSGSAA